MPWVQLDTSVPPKVVARAGARGRGERWEETAQFELAVGWVKNADGTFTPVPKLSAATLELRGKVLAAHEWLDEQLATARRLSGHTYPSSDVAWVEDEIFHVHQFLYAVYHDARYANDQFARVCDEIAKGTVEGSATIGGNRVTIPALPDVVALLNALPALRAAGKATAITAPFGWVDPATGARWSALDARENTAALRLAVPSPGVLRSGRWINSVTA